MKPALQILTAACILCICSFRSTSDPRPSLIGYWVNASSGNETLRFDAATAFHQNGSGIEFKANGKLRKRQNAGWCGTPPITYKNYDGSWQYTSDSTLLIRYEYWGGEIEEQWQIIELTDKSLRIVSTLVRTIK